MESPYDAPSTVSSISDELRRPIGVTILSFLTGVLGLVLLAAFVVLIMNRHENNEWALKRGTAPSLFWLLTGLSVLMAFVASIGMWRGTKWGWWISCCGLVFFLIQNLGLAVTANLSDGAPSVTTFASVDSLKYVVRAIVFAIVLAYWLRTSVRKYFHVEKTSRIKAVALVTVCGIGITTIITVVLQSIFLFRTR